MHFRREYATAQDIGFRALAVNLSDLAAMGARPVLATIALTVPRDVEPAWIIDAYDGMAELAKRSRIALVGGDLSGGPALSFAVTVVGEVSPQRTRLRSGARVHDVIAVTGNLGRSRAGLALLEDSALAERIGDTARVADALAAYRRPEPRLAYAKFLAASAHVHAMMDLSDGLSLDVMRLARASACGAEIHHVPLAASTLAVAEAAQADARTWALDGGDDYELLLTVERRAFVHLSRRFMKMFGVPLIEVGRCVAGAKVTQRCDGAMLSLVAGGWDHFSPGTGAAAG